MSSLQFTDPKRAALCPDRATALAWVMRAMSGPPNVVIFDYLDTDAFAPEKAAPRVQGGIRLAQHAGEPMKTGFDPSMLAADIKRLGLRIQDNLSPADIEELYFQGRTDGYYACEHVHIVRAVIE